MTAQPPALLVFGPRAADDTAAARAWVGARIEAAIMAAAPRYVVHGGARGVDQIADAIARTRDDVVRIRFELDGWIYRNDAPVRRWLGEVAHAEVAGTRRCPLLRNIAMAARLAAYAGPRHARGFTAAWSKTNGSGHMAKQCAREGVAAQVEPIPAELGPK